MLELETPDMDMSVLPMAIALSYGEVGSSLASSQNNKRTPSTLHATLNKSTIIFTASRSTKLGDDDE